MSSGKEGKVGVVEVFRSLQGEGRQAGRDAVFVRLAGCPLACVFADGAVCDTPYQQANHKVTVAALFEDLVRPLLKFDELWKFGGTLESRPMMIFTGGEPTYQPQFDTLVQAAQKRGFYVAVETNGMKWKDSLRSVHWISCSPKEDVTQGSPAEHHNPNPASPVLNEQLVNLLQSGRAGEFRYVIGERDSPKPPYREGPYHYLSPAVLSDGSGTEWKSGFPGFAPGAVERCLEIIEEDSRWRLSIQSHKIIGVR